MKTGGRGVKCRNIKQYLVCEIRFIIVIELQFYYWEVREQRQFFID